MRRSINARGLAILISCILVGLLLSAPVIAGSVVRFARNSDKVDGRHAVGAGKSTEKRSGKLVATNRSGHLPNNIIRKARKAKEADRLGDYGPTAFVRGCQPGALRGQAHVPVTLGSEFEEVLGFSTIHGGPISIEGTNCHSGKATARRISTGVYDVRLAVVGWTCGEPFPPGIITALVTVQSVEPLVSTYEPICENNNVYARVRIAGLDGNSMDAPFSIALLDENGVPIP